ncbi:MAG: hypothetical protein CMQ19_00215 [Gammaproteobacteria bacterium]|nr:hypothetical protein [Gammaproteobacteria bacterium]
MLRQEGVVFVATGNRFLTEAASSAVASRPFLSGRPIALVSDNPSAAKDLDVFDQVVEHPDPRISYRDKIAPLLNLPFSVTLFLDTDARLTASAAPLFAALGRAHLAAAHAPVRIPTGWADERIPALFPELNSGVLLLRRSLRTKLLIKRWLSLYDQLQQQFDQNWDQASLRSVVWHLQQRWRLRLLLLPAEANLRTTKPWIAGKGLAVHVVHGRVPEAEWPALLGYLNGNIDRFRSWSEWLQLHPDSVLRPKLPPDPVGF